MRTEKPLEGIKVIDCGTIIGGPLAATYLGDFGAEVIKVEHPEVGDAARNWWGDDTVWRWLGRNKKSVPIDLHDPDGQELFKLLVEDADVLIESFRPGTLEGWNVGWEDLSEINPDLIMVRTTGFGQTGPYHDRPGFGTLAESMSGFAYITGQADGPPTLPPFGLADSISALFSLFSVMFGLYWRDVNGGTGQFIDSSLVEPLFAILGDHAVVYGERGEIFERVGNVQPGTPGRRTYRTKDDKWVSISPATPSIARRVLTVVGGEELLEDPRFESPEARFEHAQEFCDVIEEWVGNHDREEVLDTFIEHQAAIAPIYNMAEIYEDPHFESREAIIEVEDDALGSVRMPGVFPKMSESPGEVVHTGPKLGEHTLEVLLDETSLTEDEVRALAARGIVTLDEEDAGSGR